MDTMAAWLEGWCDSLQAAGLTAEQAATFATAKSEFWLYLVEMLARLAEHPDPQVSSEQRLAVSTAALPVQPCISSSLWACPWCVSAPVMWHHAGSCCESIGSHGASTMVHVVSTLSNTHSNRGDADHYQIVVFSLNARASLHSLYTPACMLAVQLRAAAVSTLQRAAIGAERMGVLPPTIERAMRERLLPPTEALTKKVGRSKDTPQVSSVGATGCAAWTLQQQQANAKVSDARRKGCGV